MAIGSSDNGKSNKKKNEIVRQTTASKTNTNLIINFPQEVKAKSAQSNTAQTSVAPIIWNRLKSQGTNQIYSPFGTLLTPITTNTTASTLKHTKPGATTTSSNKTITQTQKVVPGALNRGVATSVALITPKGVKSKSTPKKPSTTSVPKPPGEGSKQPYGFKFNLPPHSWSLPVRPSVVLKPEVENR